MHVYSILITIRGMFKYVMTLQGVTRYRKVEVSYLKNILSGVLFIQVTYNSNNSDVIILHSQSTCHGL